MSVSSQNDQAVQKAIQEKAPILNPNKDVTPFIGVSSSELSAKNIKNKTQDTMRSWAIVPNPIIQMNSGKKISVLDIKKNLIQYTRLDSTGITPKNIQNKFTVFNATKRVAQASPTVGKYLAGLGLGGNGSVEWKSSDYLQNFKNQFLRFLMGKLQEKIGDVLKKIAALDPRNQLSSVSLNYLKIKFDKKSQNERMKKYDQYIILINAYAGLYTGKDTTKEVIANAKWESNYKKSTLELDANGKKIINMDFLKQKKSRNPLFGILNITEADMKSETFDIKKFYDDKLKATVRDYITNIESQKNVLRSRKILFDPAYPFDINSLYYTDQFKAKELYERSKTESNNKKTSLTDYCSLISEHRFKKEEREVIIKNRKDFLNTIISEKDDLILKQQVLNLTTSKNTISLHNPPMGSKYTILEDSIIPSAGFFYSKLKTLNATHNPTQSYRFFTTIDFAKYNNGITPKFIDDSFKILYNQTNEISFFIQNCLIPNMTIESTNTITTDFGYIQLPESKLLTDQQSFSVDLIDTDKPIMENFFLPWMQEVTSDTYVYPHRAYMKGDITIHYFVKPYYVDKGQNIPVSFLTYTLRGCYPFDIGSRTASHHASGSVDTRTVRFMFETMSVNTGDLHLSPQITIPTLKKIPEMLNPPKFD